MPDAPEYYVIGKETLRPPSLSSSGEEEGGETSPET